MKLLRRVLAQLRRWCARRSEVAERRASTPPLVFVPELLEQARNGTDALSPLLLQWASPSERAQAIRDQIERAAALVGGSRRARVLGPLTLRTSDDQVRTTVSTLLLGKTLTDLGWDVEHEPVV